jgi:hypothetical protein
MYLCVINVCFILVIYIEIIVGQAIVRVAL